MDFISSGQALELLKSNPENYTMPDSIRGLISRVDMNTPGEMPLIYSGSFTDGSTPTSANVHDNHLHTQIKYKPAK